MYFKTATLRHQRIENNLNFLDLHLPPVYIDEFIIRQPDKLHMHMHLQDILSSYQDHSCRWR